MAAATASTETVDRASFSPPPYPWSATQHRLVRMRVSVLVALLLCFVTPSDTAQQCSALSNRIRLPTNAKRTFRVGVLAIRGVESARREWTDAYSTYLTQTAGRRFDPPIEFQLRPLTFDRSVVDDAIASLTADPETDEHTFDFEYVNPSIHSCMESEIGVQPLVTVVNQRRVGNATYNLDSFGGVIFTLRSNTHINQLADLRGKRAACVSISGLGSGQMQFQELQRIGFHHIQDLRQLLFVGNQPSVVHAVLNGTVDVGFVRSDQLERTRDPQDPNKLVDLSQIKILNPQPDVTDTNGDPFPFTISTGLFPEWTLAALPHVPHIVSQEVQSALLSLADHAVVYPALQQCYELRGCSSDAGTTNSEGFADTLAPGTQDSAKECQQRCFDDLFLSSSSSSTSATSASVNLQDCATTPELAELAFRARVAGRFDGFRTALNYMPLRTMQEQTGYIDIYTDPGNPKCQRTTEIYDAVVCPEGYRKRPADDVDNGCASQGIPCHGHPCLCSPCEIIDVCGNRSVLIGDACVSFAVLIPSIMIPVVIITIAFVYAYIRHVQFQSDLLWKISKSELKLHVNANSASPSAAAAGTAHQPQAQILGRGTFGYVVLAEYRGTKVAVKRVLPPKSSTSGTGRKKNNKDEFCMSLFDSVDNLFDPTSDSAGGKNKNCTGMKHQVGASDDDEEAAKPREKDRFGLTSGFYPGTNSDKKNKRLLSSGTSSWHARSRSSFLYSREYRRLQADFMEEMRQISKLRHPCITTVMGAVVENRTEPMLVIKYMELGSLYDLLHNSTVTLESSMAIEILQDIAQGLRFLHSATPQIIHGDLKSLNVLVDGKFRAKVADFGFSQKYHLRKKAAGTPFWMAPELLRGESVNTPESDVYAFGIMLYEVFSRKDPYEQDQNHVRILKMIADKKIQKRPPTPDDCPLEIKFLMRECLRDDPAMRPTAQSLDKRLQQIDIPDIVIQNPKNIEAMDKRFPMHVAKALKAGKRVEPTTHPSASVFSCEIVDQANLLSSLASDRAAKFMDIVQMTIDNLCGVHGVFRIETVGDSFLVVANIAKNQPNHVTIMTNFALEVMESLTELKVSLDDPKDAVTSKDVKTEVAAAKVNSSDEDEELGSDEFYLPTTGGPTGDGTSLYRDNARTSFGSGTMRSDGQCSGLDTIRVKIGLHTGPVVSHVVGLQNPRFAVLGDTVKMATLLGGCTKANTIHASQDFAFELLEAADQISLRRVDDFEIHRRVGGVSYYVSQGGLGNRDDMSRTSTSKTSSTFTEATASPMGDRRPGVRVVRSGNSVGLGSASCNTSSHSRGSKDEDSKVRSILERVRKEQQERINKRLSGGSLASGPGHLRSDELVFEQIMSSDDELSIG